MNKINYSRLKKILSSKEMKNILGGSIIYCTCMCDGDFTFSGPCAGPSVEDCEKYDCPAAAEMGCRNIGCNEG